MYIFNSVDKTKLSCELWMFPDLRVVNQFSLVTSSRISPLTRIHVVFKRCELSKQSIYLSKNDVLILLTSVWCQFYDEKLSSTVKESAVLTFWCRPCCVACWKMVRRKMSPMYACNTESGCNVVECFVHQLLKLLHVHAHVA